MAQVADATTTKAMQGNPGNHAGRSRLARLNIAAPEAQTVFGCRPSVCPRRHIWQEKDQRSQNARRSALARKSNARKPNAGFNGKMKSKWRARNRSGFHPHALKRRRIRSVRPQ